MDEQIRQPMICIDYTGRPTGRPRKISYKGYTMRIEETREIDDCAIAIHGFIPEIGYHTRVIVNEIHSYFLYPFQSSTLIDRVYSRVFDELKEVIDQHFDVRDRCLSMPSKGWDYIEDTSRIGDYKKCDDEIDEEEYYSVVIGGCV